MHIEVGVVEGAKMILSYGTAAASVAFLAKQAWTALDEKGVVSLAVRSLVTTLLTLSFFQVLPHQPVGISEVHLILGSTLFLIFGLAPAGIGLLLGLLIQGLFFAPFDLPNYSINVTTLLVPLFAMAVLARKVIPENTAYKDLRYTQTLKLSAAYQGGIIGWVTFWALYGQGFGIENLTSVLSFGVAYTSVVLLEPLVDMSVLAGAKALHQMKDSDFVTTRLFYANA